jgi:hypothetical protein
MNSYTILYVEGKMIKRFKASGKKLKDAETEFKRLNPDIPVGNIKRIIIIQS